MIRSVVPGAAMACRKRPNVSAKRKSSRLFQLPEDVRPGPRWVQTGYNGNSRPDTSVTGLMGPRRTGLPWKETCAMDQRDALMADWLRDEWTMTELAVRYGIS